MIRGWSHNRRQYEVSAVAVPERNLLQIRSVLLARMLLEFFGFSAKCKTQVPEIVWRGNEACVRGYLRGLFQSDGTVQCFRQREYQLLSAPCVQPAVAPEGRAGAAGKFRHLLPVCSSGALPGSACCPTARAARSSTTARPITS